MKRFAAIAAGCLVWSAMTQVSEAQLVRVGPFGGVNIRVPFVSVDVLPFGGGTRVRAPFTSVNTGLYGYGPGYYPPRYYDDGFYGGYLPAPPVYYDVVPVYPPPVIAVPVYPRPSYLPPKYSVPIQPSPVQPLSATSVDELRASATRLRQSLASRRDDADIWLDYLGPDEIIRVIDRHEPIGTLAGLLSNYDGVVANPELASIQSADGFLQTRHALQTRLASGTDQTNLGGAANQVELTPLPQPDVNVNQPTPAEPGKPNDVKQDAELPIPKATSSI